jgi:two-component system osmolarity sensor histidine kinase EnvZ
MVETGIAPLIVPLRRHAFKRAVANLVNNAARFAEHVKVTAERQDGSLSVTVEDDGPGIPEAEREHVFRPFYRLDHARNQDSGSTGLGLAIARDIARIHGGDITLDRSPLGGLKAVLKVPV